jgi:hypothetical protein
MTQQPSQNKQILSKLEDIDRKVTRIETQIEMQPKIDEEQHKGIQQQLKAHETRISSIESSLKWIVLTILGFVIVEILKLI